MRLRTIEMVRPPMTAIASGCSICEPAPSAKASGNMPQTAARAVMTMGRRRRWALGAKSLVGVEQQDSVLGHDTDDHDEPHERSDVERGARNKQRQNDSGDGKRSEERRVG